MNLTTLIIAILAVCRVAWCYPRLPSPFNIILVAIFAIVCLLVLPNMSDTGVHF